MTAGLCGFVFLLGLVSIENDEVDLSGDRRVDWFGAFLVTSGLAMLLFVLGDGAVAVNSWRTNCKSFTSPTGSFAVMFNTNIAIND